MFTSFKERLLVGLFILLILSIPVGAYLVSQNQTVKSSASETKVKPTPMANSIPKTVTSPAQQILNASEVNLPATDTSTPEPSTTIANSYGPTLSLKAKIEGRADNNQLAKLFVGIIEGALTTNPKFLLSFTIDLPADGTYSNLSLAGLDPGSNYTALLKGPAQIATSSAFVMSPTVSNLNSSETINLLSGDLNDDNVINTADYSIAQKAYGSNSSSVNWVDLADINKDGIVNTLDLAIIIKNFGAIGASGAWTSPIPQNATTSGSPSGGSGGYWIWLPASP